MLEWFNINVIIIIIFCLMTPLLFWVFIILYKNKNNFQIVLQQLKGWKIFQYFNSFIDNIIFYLLYFNFQKYSVLFKKWNNISFFPIFSSYSLLEKFYNIKIIRWFLTVSRITSWETYGKKLERLCKTQQEFKNILFDQKVYFYKNFLVTRFQGLKFFLITSQAHLLGLFLFISWYFFYFINYLQYGYQYLMRLKIVWLMGEVSADSIGNHLWSFIFNIFEIFKFLFLRFMANPSKYWAKIEVIYQDLFSSEASLQLLKVVWKYFEAFFIYVDNIINLDFFFHEIPTFWELNIMAVLGGSQLILFSLMISSFAFFRAIPSLLFSIIIFNIKYISSLGYFILHWVQYWPLFLFNLCLNFLTIAIYISMFLSSISLVVYSFGVDMVIFLTKMFTACSDIMNYFQLQGRFFAALENLNYSTARFQGYCKFYYRNRIILPNEPWYRLVHQFFFEITELVKFIIGSSIHIFFICYKFIKSFIIHFGTFFFVTLLKVISVFSLVFIDTLLPYLQVVFSYLIFNPVCSLLLYLLLLPFTIILSFNLDVFWWWSDFFISLYDLVEAFVYWGYHQGKFIFQLFIIFCSTFWDVNFGGILWNNLRFLDPYFYDTLVDLKRIWGSYLIDFKEDIKINGIEGLEFFWESIFPGIISIFDTYFWKSILYRAFWHYSIVNLPNNEYMYIEYLLLSTVIIGFFWWLYFWIFKTQRLIWLYDFRYGKYGSIWEKVLYAPEEDDPDADWAIRPDIKGSFFFKGQEVEILSKPHKVHYVTEFSSRVHFRIFIIYLFVIILIPLGFFFSATGWSSHFQTPNWLVKSTPIEGFGWELYHPLAKHRFQNFLNLDVWHYWFKRDFIHMHRSNSKKIHRIYKAWQQRSWLPALLDYYRTFRIVNYNFAKDPSVLWAQYLFPDYFNVNASKNKLDVYNHLMVHDLQLGSTEHTKLIKYERFLEPVLDLHAPGGPAYLDDYSFGARPKIGLHKMDIKYGYPNLLYNKNSKICPDIIKFLRTRTDITPYNVATHPYITEDLHFDLLSSKYWINSKNLLEDPSPAQAQPYVIWYEDNTKSISNVVETLPDTWVFFVDDKTWSQTWRKWAAFSAVAEEYQFTKELYKAYHTSFWFCAASMFIGYPGSPAGRFYALGLDYISIKSIKPLWEGFIDDYVTYYALRRAQLEEKRPYFKDYSKVFNDAMSDAGVSYPADERDKKLFGYDSLSLNSVKIPGYADWREKYPVIHKYLELYQLHHDHRLLNKESWSEFFNNYDHSLLKKESWLAFFNKIFLMKKRAITPLLYKPNVLEKFDFFSFPPTNPITFVIPAEMNKWYHYRGRHPFTLKRIDMLNYNELPTTWHNKFLDKKWFEGTYLGDGWAKWRNQEDASHLQWSRRYSMYKIKSVPDYDYTHGELKHPYHYVPSANFSWVNNSLPLDRYYSSVYDTTLKYDNLAYFDYIFNAHKLNQKLKVEFYLNKDRLITFGTGKNVNSDILNNNKFDGKSIEFLNGFKLNGEVNHSWSSFNSLYKLSPLWERVWYMGWSYIKQRPVNKYVHLWYRNSKWHWYNTLYKFYDFHSKFNYGEGAVDDMEFPSFFRGESWQQSMWTQRQLMFTPQQMRNVYAEVSPYYWHHLRDHTMAYYPGFFPFSHYFFTPYNKYKRFGFGEVLNETEIELARRYSVRATDVLDRLFRAMMKGESDSEINAGSNYIYYMRKFRYALRRHYIYHKLGFFSDRNATMLFRWGNSWRNAAGLGRLRWKKYRVQPWNFWELGLRLRVPHKPYLSQRRFWRGYRFNLWRLLAFHTKSGEELNRIGADGIRKWSKKVFKYSYDIRIDGGFQRYIRWDKAMMAYYYISNVFGAYSGKNDSLDSLRYVKARAKKFRRDYQRFWRLYWRPEFARGKKKGGVIWWPERPMVGPKVEKKLDRPFLSPLEPTRRRWNLLAGRVALEWPFFFNSYKFTSANKRSIGSLLTKYSTIDDECMTSDRFFALKARYYRALRDLVHETEPVITVKNVSPRYFKTVTMGGISARDAEKLLRRRHFKDALREKKRRHFTHTQGPRPLNEEEQIVFNSFKYQEEGKMWDGVTDFNYQANWKKKMKRWKTRRFFIRNWPPTNKEFTRWRRIKRIANNRKGREFGYLDKNEFWTPGLTLKQKKQLDAVINRPIPGTPRNWWYHHYKEWIAPFANLPIWPSEWNTILSFPDDREYTEFKENRLVIHPDWGRFFANKMLQIKSDHIQALVSTFFSQSMDGVVERKAFTNYIKKYNEILMFKKKLSYYPSDKFLQEFSYNPKYSALTKKSLWRVVQNIWGLYLPTYPEQIICTKCCVYSGLHNAELYTKSQLAYWKAYEGKHVHITPNNYRLQTDVEYSGYLYDHLAQPALRRAFNSHELFKAHSTRRGVYWKNKVESDIIRKNTLSGLVDYNRKLILYNRLQHKNEWVNFKRELIESSKDPKNLIKVRLYIEDVSPNEIQRTTKYELPLSAWGGVPKQKIFFPRGEEALGGTGPLDPIMYRNQQIWRLKSTRAYPVASWRLQNVSSSAHKNYYDKVNNDPVQRWSKVNKPFDCLPRYYQYKTMVPIYTYRPRYYDLLPRPLTWGQYVSWHPDFNPKESSASYRIYMDETFLGKYIFMPLSTEASKVLPPELATTLSTKLHQLHSLIWNGTPNFYDFSNKKSDSLFKGWGKQMYWNDIFWGFWPGDTHLPGLTIPGGLGRGHGYFYTRRDAFLDDTKVISKKLWKHLFLDNIPGPYQLITLKNLPKWELGYNTHALYNHEWDRDGIDGLPRKVLFWRNGRKRLRKPKVVPLKQHIWSNVDQVNVSLSRRLGRYFNMVPEEMTPRWRMVPRAYYDKMLGHKWYDMPSGKEWNFTQLFIQRFHKWLTVPLWEVDWEWFYRWPVVGHILPYMFRRVPLTMHLSTMFMSKNDPIAAVTPYYLWRRRRRKAKMLKLYRKKYFPINFEIKRRPRTRTFTKFKYAGKHLEEIPVTHWSWNPAKEVLPQPRDFWLSAPSLEFYFDRPLWAEYGHLASESDGEEFGEDPEWSEYFKPMSDKWVTRWAFSEKWNYDKPYIEHIRYKTTYIWAPPALGGSPELPALEQLKQKRGMRQWLDYIHGGPLMAPLKHFDGWLYATKPIGSYQRKVVYFRKNIYATSPEVPAKNLEALIPHYLKYNVCFPEFQGYGRLYLEWVRLNKKWHARNWYLQNELLARGRRRVFRNYKGWAKRASNHFLGWPRRKHTYATRWRNQFAIPKHKKYHMKRKRIFLLDKFQKRVRLYRIWNADGEPMPHNQPDLRDNALGILQEFQIRLESLRPHGPKYLHNVPFFTYEYGKLKSMIGNHYLADSYFLLYSAIKRYQRQMLDAKKFAVKHEDWDKTKHDADDQLLLMSKLNPAFCRRRGGLVWDILAEKRSLTLQKINLSVKKAPLTPYLMEEKALSFSYIWLYSRNILLKDWKNARLPLKKSLTWRSKKIPRTLTEWQLRAKLYKNNDAGRSLQHLTTTSWYMPKWPKWKPEGFKFQMDSIYAITQKDFKSVLDLYTYIARVSNLRSMHNPLMKNLFNGGPTFRAARTMTRPTVMGDTNFIPLNCPRWDFLSDFINSTGFLC